MACPYIMLVDLPELPGFRASNAWSQLFAARAPADGTPERLVDLLHAYAQRGIDHVQVLPDPFTIAGVEALSRALELLDRG
jgi:hypothetical protein